MRVARSKSTVGTQVTGSKVRLVRVANGALGHVADAYHAGDLRACVRIGTLVCESVTGRAAHRMMQARSV